MKVTCLKRHYKTRIHKGGGTHPEGECIPVSPTQSLTTVEIQLPLVAIHTVAYHCKHITTGMTKGACCVQRAAQHQVVVQTLCFTSNFHISLSKLDAGTITQYNLNVSFLKLAAILLIPWSSFEKTMHLSQFCFQSSSYSGLGLETPRHLLAYLIMTWISLNLMTLFYRVLMLHSAIHKTSTHSRTSDIHL